MSAVAVQAISSWYAEELGEGPTLVLLHGIGMAASAWKPILDRLGASRRVIAFDLPGFGRTPSLPDSIDPTPAAIARALVGELRARGVEPRTTSPATRSEAM